MEIDVDIEILLLISIVKNGLFCSPNRWVIKLKLGLILDQLLYWERDRICSGYKH